jgi:hypothetical protein
MDFTFPEAPESVGPASPAPIGTAIWHGLTDEARKGKGRKEIEE